MTLGVGEAIVSDISTFEDSSNESDTSADSQTVTTQTNGQIGVGEYATLSDSMTSTSTASSTNTSHETETSSILPTGTSVSDLSTQTSTTTNSSLVHSNSNSSDSVTGTDGTSSTSTASSTSTDTISGGSTSTTTDRHTESSNADGSNSVVNDDVTFSSSANSTDNYTLSSTSAFNSYVPQAGGGTTIVQTANTVASGTAVSAFASHGETNTASPSTNNQTDTSDYTNLDQGTTTSLSSMAMSVVDPLSGVSTSIQSSETGSSSFGDDEGISTSSVLSPGSAVPVLTGQSHTNSSESNTDTNSLSVSVQGHPTNGATIDYSDSSTTTGTSGNTIRKQDNLSADKVDSGSVTFTSISDSTVTSTGHRNITYISNIDDGHGNSVSVNDSSVSTRSNSGSIQTSNSGSEVYSNVNGNLTSDAVNETNTLTQQSNPSRTVATTYNDTMISTDAVTGLVKTTSRSATSSDITSSHESDTWSNAHTGSIGNAGTDVVTGSSTSTGSEQASSNVQNSVTQAGILSTGERVNMTNLHIQSNVSTTNFINSNELTSDGTNSVTNSVSGTFTVPTLYNAQTGTIESTDASTGLSTIIMMSNVIDTKSSSSSTDTNHTVTSASGSTNTTPTIAGAGNLQQAWSLTTTIYQTNGSAIPVGAVITASDIGNNAGTITNGIVTNTGLSNLHTSTTIPAGTSPPISVPAPNPGQLFQTLNNAPQSTNPQAVAVQQAAQAAQISFISTSEQTANVPGAAAGGNPQQAAAGQNALAAANIGGVVSSGINVPPPAVVVPPPNVATPDPGPPTQSSNNPFQLQALIRQYGPLTFLGSVTEQPGPWNNYNPATFAAYQRTDGSTLIVNTQTGRVVNVLPPPDDSVQMQTLTARFGPLRVVRTYTDEPSAQNGYISRSYTVYERANGDLLVVDNQTGKVVWNAYHPDTPALRVGPGAQESQLRRSADIQFEDYLNYLRTAGLATDSEIEAMRSRRRLKQRVDTSIEFLDAAVGVALSFSGRRSPRAAMNDEITSIWLRNRLPSGYVNSTGTRGSIRGPVTANTPNTGEIVAQNGTKISGYAKHGINRAIGDGGKRAGTSASAILDALQNPSKITSGVDTLGRPFERFTGKYARVVVNPQTGQIISVNPLGGGGVR